MDEKVIKEESKELACEWCNQVENTCKDISCNMFGKKLPIEIKNYFKMTKSKFFIIEDNPDDLILYKNDKPILKISLPEKSTQWNVGVP